MLVLIFLVLQYTNHHHHPYIDTVLSHIPQSTKLATNPLVHPLPLSVLLSHSCQPHHTTTSPPKWWWHWQWVWPDTCRPWWPGRTAWTTWTPGTSRYCNWPLALHLCAMHYKCKHYRMTPIAILISLKQRPSWKPWRWRRDSVIEIIHKLLHGNNHWILCLLANVVNSSMPRGPKSYLLHLEIASPVMQQQIEKPQTVVSALLASSGWSTDGKSWRTGCFFIHPK